jgi:radical SAM protein with 4Fe4S-binding SPASM domain
MSSTKEKLSYLRRYLARKSFIWGHGFRIRRLINFILVELGERYAWTRALGKPYSIFIDPLNMCVLHCPLCGTGQNQPARPATRLTYDNFVAYTADLVDTLFQIKFYNYGEPFLNPDLSRMIRYATDHRVMSQVNSNLNRMSPDLADAVVNAGLSVLTVSFDGFSQEAYSAYRVGGDVAVVKKNIGLINEAKRKLNSSTPRIVLQFLVNKYNEHEYEKVSAYAQEVNAEFFPQPITIDVTNKEHRDTWLPSNDAYTHYDKTKLIKKKFRPDRRCGFLWNDTVINCDGTVSPCCHLYFKETDFGNLNDQPFSEIWNNEKFVAARKIFKDQKITNPTLVCSRCINPEAFTDMNFDLINENRTNNLK